MITLTFDDAVLNTYDIAFPLMKKHNFRGVVFVPTGILTGEVDTVRIDDAPYMNISQLSELHDAGWEIGSHTVTHRRLDQIPSREIEKELKQSKKYLEDWGFDPISLAYPYGHGLYTMEAVRLAGKYYDWARTVGDMQIGNKRPYPRYQLHGIPGFPSIPLGEDWYIFVIHVIIDEMGFENFLRQLGEKWIKVVTFRDV